MSHDIVIAAPVRTAIGTFGGTLKDTPAFGSLPRAGSVLLTATRYF